MKKVMPVLITCILLLSFMPLSLYAVNNPPAVPTTSTKPVESIEVTIMLTRLNEIQNMDLSSLSAVERKQLRKEVRAMKHEMREGNQGVFLSVGAIIIIILLLILIL